MMSEISLRPTNDYGSMVRLGREAGLEMEQLGPVLAAYGMFEGEDLVGCACLKEHEGTYLLECLAVAENKRGKGLGTRLVMAIEEEARNRGAERLLALARRPGFFARIGYRVARSGEVDYPTTSGCAGCPQYGRSCSPAIVLKLL
jgi:N-acetylglutamate synthase-like GNAT family acetyltransferase